MNPAAPVTRIRTAASYAPPLVARVSVRPLPWPPPRPWPCSPRQSFSASRISGRLPWSCRERSRCRSASPHWPELGEGRTEVVLRVRLVRTAGTGERGDRQTGDLLGARGIAAAQECGCLVGQGGAVGSRRRRWWRWWRRRRRRWCRRRRCDGRASARRLGRLLLIAAAGEERCEPGTREQRSSDDGCDERPRRPPVGRGQHAGHCSAALERLTQGRHEVGRGLEPRLRILRQRAPEDRIELRRDRRHLRLHVRGRLGGRGSRTRTADVR